MIGAAYPIFSGERGGPVLLLINEGVAGHMDWPLLEEAVPADFSGSTGIMACPTHSHLITDKSDKSPPAFGLPGRRWARGMCVQMPFSLLRAPYLDYLRRGKPQDAMWLPTEDTALYIPDWAQRERERLSGRLLPTEDRADI
jgi:hypothetical protein